MKLLIITNRKSDLSELFSTVCDCTLLDQSQANDTDLSVYDAVAVLGGTEEKAAVLNVYLREKLELFSDTGRPVFLEYVDSFRCVYSTPPIQRIQHRLVCYAEDIEGIECAELLDSHFNNYIRPHFLMPGTKPIMYYHEYTSAHDKLDCKREDIPTGDIAVFSYDNVLTVAFRMCNYLKGAFAPKSRWDNFVCYICRFLGIGIPEVFPDNACTPKKVLEKDFETELDDCINRAIGLLKNFLVLPDGSMGIYEGLSHNIRPDGERILADVIRTDCIGEAAGTFFFSGDKELIDCGHRMYSLCYGPLTIHGGEYDGMVRWTETAWNVCYQDDVARAIIPSLLLSYFCNDDRYLPNAENALRFLSNTSCKDGLRPSRTDILNYLGTDSKMTDLTHEEHGLPCAHYNSWYSAALLLYSLKTGDKELAETGIKGIERLMELYPDTVRENSETTELCRLIFPLAILYKLTGKKEHYDMLDRVFADVMSHRHASGGICEWDTGYKSTLFNNPGGECALLSRNGDPVADLLYSVNWLPLGFAFAWHATGEERFIKAWQDICEFLIKAQVISDNPKLNGAWCRGMDLDRMEYCGVPHDVGWGPCCVETGWTVAEITTGMLIGRLLKEGK